MKNSLEQIAINNLSLKAKKSNDIILYGVSPIGSTLSQFIFQDPKRSIYLTFESIVFTDVINLLVKKIVKRRRPFTYNDIVPDHENSVYDKQHQDAD